MTREEKSQVIQDLTAVLAGTNTLYLADILVIRSSSLPKKIAKSSPFLNLF